MKTRSSSYRYVAFLLVVYPKGLVLKSYTELFSGVIMECVICFHCMELILYCDEFCT
jgi:hypothetical protein